MTEPQLLQELESLVERLEIDVSRVDLEGRSGGFCITKGRRRFIIDRGLDVAAQVDLFARELARLPTDDLYILPAVRERIDRHSSTWT